MSDKGYVTGRDLMLQKQKDEVKEIGLGDVVAEMISIGDPTRPTASGKRGVLERYTVLKEELNRRWKLATTITKETPEEVLKKSVGRKKVSKKDGSNKRAVGK